MMAFRVAAAQCKKISPERLNWPSRLAGSDLLEYPQSPSMTVWNFESVDVGCDRSI